MKLKINIPVMLMIMIGFFGICLLLNTQNSDTLGQTIFISSNEVQIIEMVTDVHQSKNGLPQNMFIIDSLQQY